MSDESSMESEKNSMEEVQNVNNNNIVDKTKEDDAQDENDSTKGYGLNVRRIKNMFSVDSDPPEPKRPVLAPRPWSAFMSRSSVVMEAASPNGRHRSTGGEAVSPCHSEKKFCGTKKIFESGTTTTPAALPSPVPRERMTPLPLSTSYPEGKDTLDCSPVSSSWRSSPGAQSVSPKTEFAMPTAQIRKSSGTESLGDDPARERRKSDKPAPIFGHQVNAGPMSKRLERFLQDDDDDDDDEAEDVFHAEEKEKVIKPELRHTRDKGPVESNISPVLQPQSSSSPPIAQKPEILPRVAATSTFASRPAKVLTSPSAASTSPVSGSESPVVDKPSPTVMKLSPTVVKTSPTVVKTSPTAGLPAVASFKTSPTSILTSSTSVLASPTEDEPRFGQPPISPSSRESFKRARQFSLECPRPFRSQHDSQGVRWSRIEVPLSPTAMDTSGDFASGFPATDLTTAVSFAQKTSDTTKVISPKSKGFETDLAFPKRKISEAKTCAASETKIVKTEMDLPECKLPAADTTWAQTKTLETEMTLSEKEMSKKEEALPESKVSETDGRHFKSKVSEAEASVIKKHPDVETYSVTGVDAKVDHVRKTSPGVSCAVFEQQHFISTDATAEAGLKQEAMKDNDLKSAHILDKVQARSTYFEITADKPVKKDDKQKPFKSNIMLSEEVDTAAKIILDEKMHAQKELLDEEDGDFTSIVDAHAQLSNVSDTPATMVIESKMHAQREVIDDSDDDDDDEEDFTMAVETQIEVSRVETAAHAVDLKKPSRVCLQKKTKAFVDGDTELGLGVEGHRAAQELRGNLEPQLLVAAAPTHSAKSSIRVQEIPPAAEEGRRDAVLPVVAQTRKPAVVAADLESFPVELDKGPKGLGIGILGRGPNPEEQNIHVAALLDGGAAKVDGRIDVGDQVLEVDGVSLVGISEEFAGTLLKNTIGRVKLLIGRQKSSATKPKSPLAREALHEEPEKKKEAEQKATTKVLEQQAVPEQLAEPRIRFPGIINVEHDQIKADLSNLRQPPSVQEVPSAELGWHRLEESEISVKQLPGVFQPQVVDHREIVEPGTAEQVAPEEHTANEQIASNAASDFHDTRQPHLAVCPVATFDYEQPSTVVTEEATEKSSTVSCTSQIPLSFSESSFGTSVLKSERAALVPQPIPCDDFPSLLGGLKHAARQEPEHEAVEQDVRGRDEDSNLEHQTKYVQAWGLHSVGDEEEDDDSAAEPEEPTVPQRGAPESRGEQQGWDTVLEERGDDGQSSEPEGDNTATKLHFTKVSVVESSSSLELHGETWGPGEGELKWGSGRSLGSEEDESGEERALMELAEDRDGVKERLSERLEKGLVSRSPPPAGSHDHREKALPAERVDSTGSPGAPAEHAAQSTPLLRDVALGTVHGLLPRTSDEGPLDEGPSDEGPSDEGPSFSADPESVTDARDVLSKTLLHKGLAGDQAPEPSPCSSDEEPEPVVLKPPAEDDESKSAGEPEAEAGDGDGKKAEEPQVSFLTAGPAALAADEEEEKLDTKADAKADTKADAKADAKEDAKADAEADAQADAEVPAEEEDTRETIDGEKREKPCGPAEEGEEEPTGPLAEPDDDDDDEEKVKEDKSAADEAEEDDAENEAERGGAGEVDVPETPDTGTEELEGGLDFSAVVPLTERLDTSAHKARAQLIVKAKRQRPSRGKLRKTDSEVAEEELESTPSSPATQTVVPGAAETSSPSQPTETPIEAAKSTSLASPVSPASDARTGDEDKDAGFSSPGEGPEDTPTSKSRLKFLDIGASLRRSGRGRKSEKDQRASTLPRDGGDADGGVAVGPDMASSSCMPFLFTRKGSFSSTSSAEPGSVNASPEKRRARATLSWPSVFSRTSLETAFSGEFSPSSTSSLEMPGLVAESRVRGRSHTLTLSSEEGSEEALQSPAKQQQWANRTVPEWTPEQVSQWLAQLGMEQHVEAFTTQGVDGKQLLQLDSTKLKALGVTNLAERSSIKKRLKELRTAMEKERKAQEKMERQREKLRKKEEEQLRKSQRASKVGEESPATQ
uniref:Uncharacterized protein LOC116948594 isoform X2 n=1 Tax=Petromyzon marinus TaxID=7757 RepID=A0AAJ7TRB7_PETMA|nr:uncharacterized protein LOC116948594 isoform X2 [Petromyzon marinus]